MLSYVAFRLLLLALVIASRPSPPPKAPDGIRFDAARITVPAGCQRAVCVRLTSPTTADTPLAVTSSDPAVAEVTRDAVALPGASLAFLRVRGLQPGECELRIGESTAKVLVTGAGAARATLPEITGPADGAVLWGQFAVSVSLTDLEEPARGYAGDLLLRLSDGRTVEPVSSTGAARGPSRRAVFLVDTGEGRTSRLELEPVWRTSDGTEHVGTPVEVRVARPTDAEVAAGEAEEQYEIKRPERFSQVVRPGATGNDKEASGGRFLNNAGSEPAFCFPLKVDEDGWYQAVLTARGTLAGGAYPTVALIVDGAQYAATNARVPDEAWRRFALGVPVRLSAGEHVLTPYFENDFYVADHGDRNLYLDKIEVLRVPGGGAAPSGGGTMMQGAMNAAMADKPNAPGGAMTMMSAMNGGAGGAARAGGASDSADPWGVTGRAIRIAFDRPFDGSTIAGEFLVEGLCWWEREGARAPRVTLFVNGEARDTQRAASPRFIIDPRSLSPGMNSIELLAVLDNGAADRTPAQHIERPAGPATSDPGTAPRRFLRYTIHEEGWNDAVTKSLSTDKYPSERRAAAFFSGAEGVFTLPADLAGKFDLGIESFGQEFDGSPILCAELVTENGRTTIGEAQIGGWWTSRRAGSVELQPGEKKIAVTFTNDKYEEGKGDRNVWFQAIVLQEAAPADSMPPSARVIYPVPGASIGLADAVVAEFADDRGATRAELLVDGNPAGVSLDITGRPGRVLLPLVTRSVPEGPHTLGVRITDSSGKAGDSAGVEIRVSTSATEPGPYDKAVKLLNRLGFGPEPDELADVLTLGQEKWLRNALSQSADDPAELAAMGFAIARFPSGRGEYEASRRPITHAILTQNSVRARFVLWAENHFSTWARKTEGDRKWQEHVSFAHLGPAPFFDLLLASATSPAMLRYLDQEQSYAGRINENYAREIMELHTLGVNGGYSQSDVTSLAHLLTGWTTAREGDGMSAGEMRGWSFTFDPALSEGSATRILGVDFDRAKPDERYDRVRFAIEVLAAHPSTARYVCRKLVEHYVSVPAPEAMVSDLAQRFTETGGDMAEVLLALAHHPEFTRTDLPDRLSHPTQFALRLARTTRLMNPWLVADYMQRSGNGLFDRSTPDGYPEEDSAYVDSNAMLQRWRLAQDASWQLAGLVPDPIRYGEVPKDELEAARWMQQVVDMISVRLTGRLLGTESNAAALEVLKTSSGNRQDRVFQAAPFIVQLPESNLR